MRARWWGWPVAAALGFAGAVLPGVAVSETTPTIEARKPGLYWYWSPASVASAAGGSVAIVNPSSEVKHGVEWRSGPATPVCSGVPVGTGIAASGTNWSGSCTFPAAGEYTFYCTVHGAAMRATVKVSGGETTTTSTTATPPTTASTTGSTPSPQPTSSATLPSILAGSGAIEALAGPHGRSVRGSLSVAPAGAGGTLQVELLARRAAVARSGPNALVGRTTRRSLKAGTVRFTVALNARGLAALRRHGRLAVTVRMTLTASGASAAHLTRAVTLRR